MKILIIEDNRDAADSLRLLLELHGHEAYAAYTGTEGVSKAQVLVPSVVLSDIGLPGLDGFEVAEQLRRTAALKKTTLVAMTAYTGEEYRKRAREAGFDYYLVKPSDPDRLLEFLAAS